MVKKLQYDQLNMELDEVISKLQDSDVSLDNALILYKRGQEIVKDLQKYLKTVKNTVEKINSGQSTG